MAILLKQARQILTMNDGLGLIQDGSVLIENDIIKKVGRLNEQGFRGRVIDCTGCVVTPGLIDAHTHLVFAGTREDEFAMRLEGIKYETIAKKGGGILRTVAMTRSASEDELYKLAAERIKMIIRHGTTTIEIKSGYGLSLSEELKILRVINKLKDNTPLDVIPTYLVHTIPRFMKRRDYVDMQCEEILPEVARLKLAEFCDIFCDKTAFTKSESEKILKKAKELGFALKIHTDELANVGGAKLAAKLGCVSAEHLIYTTKSGINAMKKAGVIPVLLPGTSLYLQTERKPLIKDFMESGLPIAIASDFNPGTCMIYSMPKIISLASLVYRMPVELALMAATINAARAIRKEDRVGKIKHNYQADFVIWNVDDYRKIPYQFGEDLIKVVIKKGKIIYETNS
ncbi:MAG: imidazolonepropionase [candidate division WOR-3 bacterium]|nr:imidazolonepropionase [candidate division WOR-3 bacterium]